MSTMTRFSSVPYTGPAPTNRDPYIPAGLEEIDARAAQIESKISAHGIVREPNQDMPTFLVERDSIIATLTALRDDAELQFKMPLDLFGVDYPKRESGRFDVVYQLYSLKNNDRVRLKVRVDEDEKVPSAFPVFKGFEWFEREAYDMYGIEFEGHPDMRRILCHEAFQGHALRKDYDPAQRWLLTEKDVATLRPVVKNPPEDSEFEQVTLNLGPSHPATHGTLRIAVTLDGETIIGADTEIGYLHRCFEKMSETHTYQQVIPFTDRLNYMSAIINNVGYCTTVERMLGIEAPPRAKHILLILSEFMRIADHLVNIGTNCVDIGALTNFWYLYAPREEMYSLIESCCGARLLPSYTRIGGISVDAPEDFLERAQKLITQLPKHLDDVDRLLTKNRIFRERMENVGVISQEDAIAWGFTGPCLRATGVPYDVRKAFPYLGYETYDFDIPIATAGDNYARYEVRMEEMRQSIRIIQQAIDRGMPEGPVIVNDPYIALPPKEKVYNEMESLIYHFKLIMHGIQPPVGESYFSVEGGNGELGFYVVSDGTKNPYRVRCRPPCFAIYQAFRDIATGGTIADAIATLGTINVIAGELDR